MNQRKSFQIGLLPHLLGFLASALTVQVLLFEKLWASAVASGPDVPALLWVLVSPLSSYEAHVASRAPRQPLSTEVGDCAEPPHPGGNVAVGSCSAGQAAWEVSGTLLHELIITNRLFSKDLKLVGSFRCTKSFTYKTLSKIGCTHGPILQMGKQDPAGPGASSQPWATQVPRRPAGIIFGGGTMTAPRPGQTHGPGKSSLVLKSLC